MHYLDGVKVKGNKSELIIVEETNEIAVITFYKKVSTNIIML